MYGSGFCIVNRSKAHSFSCLCHKTMNSGFIGCTSALGQGLAAMYALAYAYHLLVGLLGELDRTGLKAFRLSPLSHHPPVAVSLPHIVEPLDKERRNKPKVRGSIFLLGFFNNFCFCHFFFDCISVAIK